MPKSCGTYRAITLIRYPEINFVRIIPIGKINIFGIAKEAVKSPVAKEAYELPKFP